MSEKLNLVYHLDPNVDLNDLENERFDNIFDLLPLIKKLKRSNDVWTFVDFDDTLCTRYYQLQDSRLSENRGENWNKLILTKLWWYKKFTEDNYTKELLTNELIDIVSKNTFTILTAWNKEFQELKIKAVWLHDISRIIVPKSEDKPLALLNYIIEEWVIPKRVEIYDDKIWHLCDWLKDLINFIWIDLNIFKVWLKWTNLDTLEEFNY